MKTLDRISAPDFGVIEKIDFIKAEESKLDNGIPVYAINAGVQDVVKIEFSFPAGNWHSRKPLVAYATNTMLNEGTRTMTAADIADKVDYYGAYLQADSGSDYSSVVLYSLNKHLANTLPVVKEMLTDSIFPKHEFDIFQQNQKQNLLINNEQVDYIARRRFKEIIFGTGHPYGHLNTLEDYDALTVADFIDYFKKHYHAKNCTIFVSGKLDKSVFTLLNNCFGQKDWFSNANHSVLTSIISGTIEENKKQFIKKNDAVQSAIMIGKKMFSKTHPDYPAMQILNTLLGGYFGSRLMNNIREDKGYTYGIGSAVASMQNSGYFFISTEVGVDVCNKALDEIYFEINRLITEPVPEEELQLVKNYLMGNFLRSIDGPFALADKFKGIHLYGLGYDYYDRFFNTIKTIQSQDVQTLAAKYFSIDTMYELVVGNKE